MMTQGQRRILIGYLLTFVVAIFLAGCSGGDSAATSDGDTAGDKNPGGELPVGGFPDRPDLPDVPREEVPTEIVNAGRIPIVAYDYNIAPEQLTEISYFVELEALGWGGQDIESNSAVSVTYSWSFLVKPDGSTARLENTTSNIVSFTADKIGAYLVQLVVTAGGVSERDVGMALIYNSEDANSPDEPHFHDGLRSRCVDCHDGSDVTESGQVVTNKSGDHLATSNLCQACHTSFGFGVIPYVDHLEVFGSCNECHNGELAVGKSSQHVETDAECIECHNTIDFVSREEDGSYDHSNATAACSTCHNGNYIIGKHDTHPPTSDSCNNCHTTEAFMPPLVDHNNLSDECVFCHDGSTATGKSNVPDQINYPHPVTSEDCSICHNTRSFVLAGGNFDHGVLNYNDIRCDTCHIDSTSPNARGVDQDHINLQPSQDCGLCHNTTDFFPATYDHTGIVDGCSDAGCHTGAEGEAIGKSANHMPTDLGCHVCHTPGTFASGTFDHDLSGYTPTPTCESCHDDVISTGKGLNHIPTNEDCGTCHGVETFSDVVFDHATIGNTRCDACHDGLIASGKPNNHVPTNEDCGVCHVGLDQRTPPYEDFTNPTFSHDGITDNCQSCHDGVIATGKPLDTHIPTQEDCSVCHTDTTTFSGGQFDHTGVTRGCGGCHNERIAIGKTSDPKNPGFSNNHVPTEQDCYLCHATDTFVGANNFAHTDIAGNCESCHNGNFSSIGARGKDAMVDPPHVQTSQDCGVCHNTLDFADAFVDHSSPEVLSVRCDSCHNNDPLIAGRGKPDNHLPTNEDCGFCHVAGGTFTTAVVDHTSEAVTNAPSCESCHDGTNATGKAAKIDHVQTDQDCDVCHTTTTFAGAQFDHTGIVDNCVECHNGVTAIGKHNDHVPSNNECHVCHQTTGFIPATFDHTGIVDNCTGCHDGSLATGKPANHIVTNGDCGLCHTTTAFIPATFDHTGIVDGCSVCHDGDTATGMPANGHVPTNGRDCNVCHTTATFVGGTFDHQGVNGDCNSCHQGDKGQGHFGTNRECDACHSTQRWAPADFNHNGVADYPGDHRVNPGCTQCHRQNAETIDPYPTPQYANPFTCAACHANDFDNGEHNGGLARNADCGDSGCHSVNDRNWD